LLWGWKLLFLRELLPRREFREAIYLRLGKGWLW